ncbi:MAG TPA: hypothetical protein VJW20_07615 [Candidatus Angelobacter sp.]|nr:hypothetical protein [Candidatus Angelobacter sp.]
MDDISVYERSKKKSHLGTIWYEIAMLEFCHDELAQNKKRSEPEHNLLIEGFLLHFRNLVEFFSGAKHRGKKRMTKPAKTGKKYSDLSTAAPEVWANRKLTSAELAAIQAPARKIEDAHFKEISQYLQHCTERRFSEFKQWQLDAMLKDLLPIVKAFQHSFPRPSPTRERSEAVLASDAGHTLSITTLSAASIFGLAVLEEEGKEKK